MKFSIITPTYKRKDELLRAVNSILQQKHQDWEMIIINDSPDDRTYDDIKMALSDERILYIKNSTNSGVNYSRNVGINHISPVSDYTIFLDDDDFLEENALSVLSNLINAHAHEKWIITNRSISKGTQLTHGPKSGAHLDYARDYLLLRRLSGDATHCIKSEYLRNIRFAKTIKQGEEWLFYFELSKKAMIVYFDVNTTLTDGYDMISGLNFRSRRRLSEIPALIKEGKMRGIALSPYFCFYILIRTLKAVLKIQKQ